MAMAFSKMGGEIKIDTNKIIAKPANVEDSPDTKLLKIQQEKMKLQE